MKESLEILTVLFFVSLLYSSVGHGGASGYLAALGMLGVSAVFMRPAALVLNLFVAGIAFFQYYRGGHFRWKLFYPFALLSVPMAFLGSKVALPEVLYKQALGVCLILAVLRILGLFNRKETLPDRELPLVTGLMIGALLGFVSGMIGIGGGIILSPVILLCRWGTMKETAAVSALFILVNSMAGLVGLFGQGMHWHPQLYLWVLVAIVGSVLGSYWGSHKAANQGLKNMLALVLLAASIKLIHG